VTDGRPGVTDELPRFAAAQRWVHRVTALLVGVCIVTAAMLYYGPLALAVGHRRTVELVHVWAGFALPAPALLGFASGVYRADLRRLNRFTSADWRWLRSRTRRDGTIRVGKFNAGQKLNAALSAGSILVLLGTGVILFFPGLTRLSYRTGATLAHDWFALAFGLLVMGHIAMAVKSPEARRGMRTGRVARGWARREHEAWADEVGESGSPGTDPGTVVR
jgi:formate dehydrogenase subunit gamma